MPREIASEVGPRDQIKEAAPPGVVHGVGALAEHPVLARVMDVELHRADGLQPRAVALRILGELHQGAEVHRVRYGDGREAEPLAAGLLHDFPDVIQAVYHRAVRVHAEMDKLEVARHLVLQEKFLHGAE